MLVGIVEQDYSRFRISFQYGFNSPSPLFVHMHACLRKLAEILHGLVSDVCSS